MTTGIKQGFRYFILCLTAVLISQCAAAQRFVTPLPLGQSVYDPAVRVPVAVQYRLASWCLGDARRVAGWSFMSDIPDSVCFVRSSFYKNSGYDRGHLMAAADRSFDPGVMRSTFVMSNVAPQTPALNRGLWQRAEEETRRIAIAHGTVEVYCCPVFFLTDTAWIAGGRVAVPHAFLRIVLNQRCDSIIKSWVLLNK